MSFAYGSRRARPVLELLEDRTTPSTLDVTNGVLTYTAGTGVNNNLTVSLSRRAYTFTDTENFTLTSGAMSAGFTGSGTMTVTGGLASNITSIGINLGDGIDSFNLGPADATLSALSVTDGGQSGDTANISSGPVSLNSSLALNKFGIINVNSAVSANGTITLSATQALNVNARLITIANISLTGDPISINASVLTTLFVTLTDVGASGVTEAGSGAITADSLLVADGGTTSGPFQLTGNNLVTFLAGSVHNTLLFSDMAQVLNVSSMGGTAGLTTNGHNLALVEAGRMYLGNGNSSAAFNLTAANAGIFLVAGGGVGEFAGCSVTAYGLSLQGFADFNLTQGANNVFDLTAFLFFGPLSYVSQEGMVVGGIDGVAGITTNGANLTLISGNGLLAVGDATSATQDINTGGGTADLAAAGLYENANGAIVANALRVQGNVGFQATQANLVGTIAVNVFGNFDFANSSLLIVGNVLGTDGITTGAGDITLMADTMNFFGFFNGGSANGSSTLTLEPITLSTNLTLGGTADGLNLFDLGQIQGTFTSIVFGAAAGTGSITVVSPVSLPTNVVLRTMGTITGIGNITVPPGDTVTTQP